MMGRPPFALLACSLACLLSCSVWTQPAQNLARVGFVPRVAGPAGPSAVEFVEASFRSRHASLSPAEMRAVSEAIVAESVRNELSWDLVLAVIHTESGFHNFAVSRVGALGLMQIMPATGELLAGQLDLEWDGAETLFRPLVNVKMGTSYLAYLYDRFGDWDLALAAYNWGPGRISWKLRNGRVLPVEYSNKVMARLQSPLTP